MAWAFRPPTSRPPRNPFCSRETSSKSTPSCYDTPHSPLPVLLPPLFIGVSIRHLPLLHQWQVGHAGVLTCAALSVHEWLPGWPEGLLSGWYSGLLLQEDGRTGDFVRPFPRSPMATQASEAGQAPMVGREQATRVPGGQLDGDAMSPHMPVILHFACCSSQALWRRRCDGVARYLLHGTLSAPPLRAHLLLG